MEDGGEILGVVELQDSRRQEWFRGAAPEGQGKVPQQWRVQGPRPWGTSCSSGIAQLPAGRAGHFFLPLKKSLVLHWENISGPQRKDPTTSLFSVFGSLVILWQTWCICDKFL